MTDRPLAAYATVTAAYWAFMLTDGALRMLVLLHFHRLGFTPVQLAFLFVVYEIAGMATNLTAGWIAARFGLIVTLYAGLAVQIAALIALSFLDPTWSLAISVAFVMAVQGASGVAKDLTKMSSKSAVKLLAPSQDGGLFRWVALLTGSKNAIKGLGFFTGAALLATLGYAMALWVMAGALAIILALIVPTMPGGLPRGRKGAKFTEVFSKDASINWLSAARLFLFGARDVWFVVGVPIFLTQTLGGPNSQAAFFATGTFMAVWIIFYGAVQAAAPQLLGAAHLSLHETTRRTANWCLAILVLPVVLVLATSNAPLLIAGLLVYGAAFAVNSALHSYLILALTKAERVTLDVGFYYMSNAAGRLVGTVLSGVSYQVGGLVACLLTSAAMAGLSFLAARRLVQKTALTV